MKTSRTTVKKLLCLVLSVAASSAWSADGTWLSASGTPAEGNGDWSDTTKWLGGNIADGSGSTLTLQAPTGSIAPESGALVGGYVINLDSNRTVQNITLGAGTWSSSQAYRITGTGDLKFAGAALPTITTVATAATMLEIAPLSVSGTQGIRFQNSGRVYWNPGTMNITGPFVINGAVEITRAEALGGGEIEMAGGTPRLWIKPSAGGMEISNDFRLGVNGAQSAGFVWSDISAGVVTLSGDIYQGNAGFVSNMAYTSNTGGGAQRFVVSGNNSYKGTTLIGNAGSVLVLARSDTALGIGENVAITLGNATAGLGLSGNITISDKTVTLNGMGFSGTGFDAVQWNGSLFNQSGTNTWAGQVLLGSTANPRIGVAAGSKLTIDGVISGSAVGGLIKAGDGILELAKANTHSTGTIINAGSLLVSHNQALASGPVKVESGGNLWINTATMLAVSSLDLDTDSSLSFSLNGMFDATGLAVSGDQIGAGLYEVNILDGGGFAEGSYTLLTVEGNRAATGFQLGTMVEGYNGDLIWGDGLLILNVTAVPEPRTALLIGVAMLFCAMQRKWKNVARRAVPRIRPGCDTHMSMKETGSTRARWHSGKFIFPALIAVLALPFAMAGEISWPMEFEFSALPSELDSRWKKLGGGTSDVSENAVVITSTAEGGGAWIFDGQAGGDWDAGKPTTVEFRMRVEAVDDGAESGAHVVLKDDDRVYEFALPNSETKTYRIVLEDTQAALYEIGSSAEPIISLGKPLQRDAYPESVLHPNSILFGDLGRAIGGVSRWEFIRWTNEGAYRPNP